MSEAEGSKGNRKDTFDAGYCREDMYAEDNMRRRRSCMIGANGSATSDQYLSYIETPLRYSLA